MKGTGRIDFDYATPIVLIQGLQLPLEIQPKPAAFSGKIEDSQSHTESPGKLPKGTPSQTPRSFIPPQQAEIKERKQTAKKEEKKEDNTPFWLR